jgi:hypothetical protein
MLTYHDGLYTEEYLKQIVPGLIRRGMLETAYGRAWFKVYLDENSELSSSVAAEAIMEIGRKVLNEAEPVDCRATFNKRVGAMQGFLELPAED